LFTKELTLKKRSIIVNGIQFHHITVKEAYKKFVKSLTFELVNYEENEVDVYFSDTHHQQAKDGSCWVIIPKGKR
jgi:hypothetical protein